MNSNSLQGCFDSHQIQNINKLLVQKQFQTQQATLQQQNKNYLYSGPEQMDDFENE